MSAGSVVVLFFQYSFLSVLISFKYISLLSLPILLISVVFVKNQILAFLRILSLCIPFPCSKFCYFLFLLLLVLYNILFGNIWVDIKYIHI